MRRRWTQSEVAYLIDARAEGKKSGKEMASDLGKSIGSIYRKSSMLGVSWGDCYSATVAGERMRSNAAKVTAERIMSTRLTPVELDRKIAGFAGYYGWEAAVEEFGLEPETAKSLARMCAA